MLKNLNINSGGRVQKISSKIAEKETFVEEHWGCARRSL